MSANVAIISGKADARELVPAAWGARQGGELSLDLLKNIQHWPLLTSSSTKAFSQNILSLFLRRNSPCDSFSWAFNQQCRKPSNSVTALVAFSKTVLFIIFWEKKAKHGYSFEFPSLAYMYSDFDEYVLTGYEWILAIPKHLPPIARLSLLVSLDEYVDMDADNEVNRRSGCGT